MSVSENIKKYRIERGLTQNQLGKLCNIAESTIRRYELGKLNPKFETLQKIASVLDVHVLVLMGQISEQLSQEISDTSISCSAAFMAILKNIYGKIDILQTKANGYINYKYILGVGKSSITISELTYDNMYEAMENLIKLYVNTSQDEMYSQECFQLMYILKDMSPKDIKAITDYAKYIESKRENL